jgi:hypothetical protein
VRLLNTTTRSSLTSERVKLLYVGCQTCDVDLKIEAAIDESIRVCMEGTRITKMAFGNVSTPGMLLCKIVLQIFGYTKSGRNVAAEIIWETFLSTVAVVKRRQDMIALGSTYLSTYIGGGLISGVMEGVAEAGAALFGVTVGGGIIIAGVAFQRLMATFKAARYIIMATVDVLLIMIQVFWHDPSIITEGNVRDICEAYQSEAEVVHADVVQMLSRLGLNDTIPMKWDDIELRKGISEIVGKHRKRPSE